MADNKYLYCKKCNKYPDTIIEVYDSATQKRTWNGDDYEATEAEELGESVLFCGDCEGRLEEKDNMVDQEELNKTAQEKGSE